MPTDEPEVSADRFAEHFRITLSPEIRDWIESGLWQVNGPGEFAFPVDPRRLIDSPGDFIWPALMPPDFLPLIGNGAGDWLCGRVDEHSRVNQIAHWYHGGGDWIPWGSGLSEAILFDFVSPKLPGPHRRHAIEAEARRPGSIEDLQENVWLRWAANRFADPIGDAITRIAGKSFDRLADDLAMLLVDHGIAETAVRCELVQCELARPELDSSSCVDWSIIQSHCEAVLRRTDELAWPWEWLGLARYQRGCVEEAKNAWIKAATCSAFTDQLIRMQPFLAAGIEDSPDSQFSIAMLRRMAINEVDVSQSIDADYVNGILAAPSGGAKRFAFEHWRSRAKELRESGDLAGAVNMLMRAGWDLGTEPMSVYGELLDQIVEDAASAGQQGRSTLARIHAAVWAG